MMTDEISQAVERFDPYTDEGNRYNYGDMEPFEEGDWVRYDDYAALSARVAELEGRERMIVSHATGGKITGVSMSVNDICVEISRSRNDVYEGGKQAGDYASLFARVAELEDRNRLDIFAVERWKARAATLEERYLAVVGDKINLRGEVATLEAKLASAGLLLSEYRHKTPLGNQPHMIAHRVDDFLAEITETKENDT